MENIFDIIIIGRGPAGISAALYAQRAAMKTLVIGMNSQALEKAEAIENYYGTGKPVSGKELFEAGVKQAKDVGIEIVEDQVVGINWNGDYTVKSTKNEYKAKAVIMSTGTKRSAPRIPGLRELEGMGVSYCAVCDGFFYKGKTVAVLGSGEYAVEEATYLKDIAQNVVILTNAEQPKVMSETFEYITKPIKSFEGVGKLERIVFNDDSDIEVQGLFVAMGTAGATDLAKKLGAQLSGNYIWVDKNMQTNLPGLYAAGDTTGGMLQISKAVYEGAMAATEAIKFVRSLKNNG